MIYVEWYAIQALLFVLEPFIAVCDYITWNVANVTVAAALIDVVLVLLAVRSAS